MAKYTPTTSTAAYLLPGMSIQLRIPVYATRPSGYFAMPAEGINISKFFGETNTVSTPVNGFVVEDKTVGAIQQDPSDKTAVIYTHKKAQKNSIWFFALSGETMLVDIVSVPIHDHSSIVQGGPAYGTYFSDDEEKTS